MAACQHHCGSLFYLMFSWISNSVQVLNSTNRAQCHSECEIHRLRQIMRPSNFTKQRKVSAGLSWEIHLQTSNIPTISHPCLSLLLCSPQVVIELDIDFQIILVAASNLKFCLNHPTVRVTARQHFCLIFLQREINPRHLNSVPSYFTGRLGKAQRGKVIFF
jgi:hypothetical protein